MSATVLSLLTEARDAIERGWCQGHFYTEGDDGSFSFCSSGAIWDATRPTFEDTELAQKAERLFCEANGIIEIETWNDMPERTKAHVLEAFDTAIRYAGGKTSSTPALPTKGTGPNGPQGAPASGSSESDEP